MPLIIPDYLFTFHIAASALVLMCVLALIWAGVARMPVQKKKERNTTAGILSAVLLGWFVVALYLGSKNLYWAGNNPGVPTIQYGIFIPIIIGLLALLRSARFIRLIDALPLSWLVGVQFYRALGFMFLVLWWDGHLPWQFALSAGVGDIATGLLALVVAYMALRNMRGTHRAAYGWCLFGIADLVIAVTMGTLTSPGLTHFVAQDNPNMLITAYPLVMIPTFAVPVSIILHGLCLWKLRRARG